MQQQIALLGEILDNIQKLTAAVRIIADQIERDAQVSIVGEERNSRSATSPTSEVNNEPKKSKHKAGAGQ